MQLFQVRKSGNQGNLSAKSDFIGIFFGKSGNFSSHIPKLRNFAVPFFQNWNFFSGNRKILFSTHFLPVVGAQTEFFIPWSSHPEPPYSTAFYTSKKCDIWKSACACLQPISKANFPIQDGRRPNKTENSS